MKKKKIMLKKKIIITVMCVKQILITKESNVKQHIVKGLQMKNGDGLIGEYYCLA